MTASWTPPDRTDFARRLIVIASGLVLAPILHRVLHALHADDYN
ncbi:hypothetical protein [Vitreimonas flagellata]|nr:hypothetical protein [Vitreimonas flagellata]